MKFATQLDHIRKRQLDTEIETNRLENQAFDGNESMAIGFESLYNANGLAWRAEGR
jgi:hypothetical protein